jgi:protein-tyrosine phosphatase
MLGRKNTQPLVDIHCHLLPHLDDGAKSLTDALNMASLAVENGIHTVIATPHHGNGRYDNEGDIVDKAVFEFNEELVRQDISLTVLPGQEVHVYEGLLDDLSKGRLRTLAGTQYLLIELPSNRIPDDFDDLLHELYVLNLTPVIAHPERNLEFYKNPRRLHEYVKQGVLLQLTSQSLLGHFGKKVQKFAYRLCKEQWIHLIASDAHNITTRPCDLLQAMGFIESHFGEERVRYYQYNSLYLLQNEKIIKQTFDKKWMRRFRLWDIFPTGVYKK